MSTDAERLGEATGEMLLVGGTGCGCRRSTGVVSCDERGAGALQNALHGGWGGVEHVGDTMLEKPSTSCRTKNCGLTGWQRCSATMNVSSTASRDFVPRLRVRERGSGSWSSNASG